MLNIACARTIILAVHEIMCGKKGQEKDFPVLRDSRSRYVECNDIIPYSWLQTSVV